MLIGTNIAIWGGSALDKYANKDANFVKQCGKTCNGKVTEVNTQTLTCKCHVGK